MTGILTLGRELVAELTPWPALVETLAAAFREQCEMPERLHYDIRVPDAPPGVLLVMPAWNVGGLLGVKLVQVYPGNSSLGKPAVHGIYMLASAVDGTVLAMLDAEELTARRTAAVSALASTYLSRPASRRLLVMGTGRLAFNMAAAHASVRPLNQISIWGRSRDKAAHVAARVAEELRMDAAVVGDLPDAISRADIISTVTTTLDPILEGRFLMPGTHIDLVGGFTPTMREADDEVIRRSQVYVDNVATAPREAGDICGPVERGLMNARDIRGDLFGLCRGSVPGRSSEQDITVFKSIGIALEDLAAAGLAWTTLKPR